MQRKEGIVQKTLTFVNGLIDYQLCFWVLYWTKNH